MNDTVRETLQDSVEAAKLEAENVNDDAVKAPEPTESEAKAAEAGWHAEGTDKDGNTLSADEFLARKPLFNKINHLNNDINDLKGMVRSLQDDNKKITVASMAKQEVLMVQLKAAKEQALNDLDTDKVRVIDGQIDEVRETIANNTEAKGAPEAEWNSEYLTFLKENDWYDNQPGLGRAADIIAKQIMATDKGTKPSALYKAVAEQVREQFPDRFKEAVATKTNKVSSSNSRGSSVKGSNKQVRLSDLDEETRRVVRNMMEMTGKTEEEYLKNYEL